MVYYGNNITMKEGVLMKLKIFIIAVTLFLIFAFPEKVKADTGNIFYLTFNEYDEENFSVVNINFEDNLNEAQKAELIFTEMLNNEKVTFVPENTKLLSTYFKNGHLILNLSPEIMNYGGNYYEECLIKQFTKTALDIPGVNALTLLIDGKLTYLPEGTIVYRYINENGVDFYEDKLD